VHAYFSIDPAIIWSTAEQRVPELAVRVAAILAVLEAEQTK
jgi:uncharacterized protein with HEPN domain